MQCLPALECEVLKATICNWLQLHHLEARFIIVNIAPLRTPALARILATTSPHPLSLATNLPLSTQTAPAFLLAITSLLTPSAATSTSNTLPTPTHPPPPPPPKLYYLRTFLVCYLALGEQRDHRRIEGVEVLRSTACDQIAITYHLLIDPIAAGVTNIDLEARPACQRATLYEV